MYKWNSHQCYYRRHSYCNRRFHARTRWYLLMIKLHMYYICKVIVHVDVTIAINFGSMCFMFVKLVLISWDSYLICRMFSSMYMYWYRIMILIHVMIFHKITKLTRQYSINIAASIFLELDSAAPFLSLLYTQDITSYVTTRNKNSLAISSMLKKSPQNLDGHVPLKRLIM